MESASGYLGTIVMLAIAAIGGLGGYFTLRATVQAESRENARRFDESEKDRKELRSRIETVDRESVKREDFNRFDDKIGLRFKDLEHAIGNAALKTEAAVKNVLRDLLPGGRSA